MKCLKLMVAALAIGVCVVTASADTVSYNTSISASSSLAPSLQKFNPALGTLTGVSVSLNVAVTPIAEVLNFGSPAAFTEAWVGTNPGSAPNPTAGPDVPFTITDPYNGANTVSTDYSYNVGAGIANFGLNTFADPIPVSLATLISTVPSASFSNYTGAGTYSLAYTTSTIASSQGSGTSLSFGGDRSLAGSATVTYTYAAAVPLPTSVMGGLVLIGAVLSARKLRLA